jgi:hypothetical protein
MTQFVRLEGETDKQLTLLEACESIRNGKVHERYFDVSLESFDAIPGKPFAYWISPEVRRKFKLLPPFGSGKRSAWVGLQTNDNFQWLRQWWEPTEISSELFGLSPFVKGGSYSPFYIDVHLGVRWGANGRLMKVWKSEQLRKKLITANNSKCWNEQHYFKEGMTWPLRAHSFAPQVMPKGCIFSIRGAVAFSDPGKELETLSLFNSSAFDYLYKTALGRFGFPEFVTGVLLKMPWASCDPMVGKALSNLARKAWCAKRKTYSIFETSHAFLLPAALRPRLDDYDPIEIEAELADIQIKINDIAFDLYGFSDADRAAALGSSGGADEDADDSEDDDGAEAIDQTDGLLSWAAGVAFGRFDWRLASGEREAPPEPDPFDPLPAKSPGMLPEGAEPFHAHSGILVDDKGHPNDLARLIEGVLARVEAPVPADVRRWLQRDFFKFHLGQYSKSRRKAPIYWPISTSSGSYTLWLYYPSLTDQTLFTAVNDFIEPKLEQVAQDVAALRSKGSARSRDDEKNFEALQTLELELIELRDTLLAIAQTYRPNHDDGVQITAAPLWQLFRHKPWQKILKDTWAKLEKGDYDWAHLAMAYWPDRVREKCKTDKSLAIAHNLEHLYVEPEPTKASGRKKDG